MDVVPTDIAAGLVLLYHSETTRLQSVDAQSHHCSRPPNLHSFSDNDASHPRSIPAGTANVINDDITDISPDVTNHRTEAGVEVFTDIATDRYQEVSSFEKPDSSVNGNPRPIPDGPDHSSDRNAHLTDPSSDPIKDHNPPVPSVDMDINVEHGEEQDWTRIGLLVHYMKFAMACYGWPLYVMMHLETGGACKIVGCCR